MRRVIVLASVACAACASELLPGFDGDATPTPTPGERIWRSWEIQTQGTVPAGFVRSTDGTLVAEVAVYAATAGTLVPLSSFVPGTSGLPSRVANVWHPTDAPVPYVGKSAIGRGADVGEAPAPDPLGVHDLQLHPSSTADAVLAFVVPTAGRYSVFALEVRRPENDCSSAGQSARAWVQREGFPNTMLDAVATSRMWIHDPGALDAGPMQPGERILVGAGAYEVDTCDATEVSFTIRRRP